MLFRSPSESCPARVRRRLEHFASKAGVGIDGLGPTLMAALVAKGALREPADLYALRREDLLAAGAPGAKAAERLLAAINHSRSAEAWRFIAGAGSAIYATGAQVFLADVSTPQTRARYLGTNQGALLLGCQPLSDACGDGANAHAAFAGGSGGVAQSAAFSRGNRLSSRQTSLSHSAAGG